MIVKRTSLMLLFCGGLVLGILPASAEDRLSSLPPAGIEISGWIGRQIHEDAANGWVSVCNRMSHQGILGWDANTQEPIPYYLPWDKGGAKGREAWNRSVPYYQTLIEPMETHVEIDKEGLAVVQRGPLVYALPVEGRRTQVDPWGSFEEVVTSDSKWNCALLLDKANPAGSFHFVELKVPENATVWEYPRAALEVEAVRVLEWTFEKDPALLIPSVTQDIPEPPFPARPIRATGPKEKIRLVPYGCTILRMTHLPVVDSSN